MYLFIHTHTEKTSNSQYICINNYNNNDKIK